MWNHAKNQWKGSNLFSMTNQIFRTLPFLTGYNSLCKALQSHELYSTFWEKLLVLTKSRPPSVLHRWKATDLPFRMVKKTFFFVHPVKRQIFGDASGQTSALILTVCCTAIYYP